MNATFDCNSQNEPNLFIQIDATPRALLDWSQTPRFRLSHICNTRHKDLPKPKNIIETITCPALAGRPGIDRPNPPVYDRNGPRQGIRKVRALRTGSWGWANEFARIP
jgi:hypothetical protein